MTKHPTNKVFIAASLDGFIADEQGKVDFLNAFSDPQQGDMGYTTFIENIDAILMGRKTYETVLSFGIDWPYAKPVFIWTTQNISISESLKEKVIPLRGSLEEILHQIHKQGYHDLYIDGGQTIQSFLNAGLIHEMTLSTIPVLLGSGIPLFKNVKNHQQFKCTNTVCFPNGIVQNQFVKQ